MKAYCELKLNNYEAKATVRSAVIKKRSLFPPCRAPKQISLVASCCRLSLLVLRVSCTLKIKR